jgi:hypothetical protein
VMGLVVCRMGGSVRKEDYGRNLGGHRRMDIQDA